MAIMSETVKTVRKTLGDLEKNVVAVEKSLVRSFQKLTKIDFKKELKAAVAQLRSTFTFAAKDDLRTLMAKVDQLERRAIAVRVARPKPTAVVVLHLGDLALLGAARGRVNVHRGVQGIDFRRFFVQLLDELLAGRILEGRVAHVDGHRPTSE